MLKDIFCRNKLANEYNVANHKFLKKISAKLFAKLNVSVFCYRKYFFDGSYIALSTDLKFQELQFKKIVELGDVCYQSILNSKYREFVYFLWPTVPDLKDKIISCLINCNIWNGLTIYWRTEKYVESFSFAGSLHDINMQNYLINNIDILKDFVINFWRNEKKLIIFDKSSMAYFDKYEPFKFQDIKLREKISLTIRQEECISLIAKGYTSKKVAQILNIAPKTVEHHIIAIKEKASINYKDELLDMYHEGKFLMQKEDF